jgi:dinuclear metal center YbgI/SA1388 family protein
MVLSDLYKILESWAPTAIAWERDNVGLQIGSPDQRIKKILVALDITDQVVDEAVRKKVDTVISHHPLYFHFPRSLRTDERLGRLSVKIIRAGLSVYSIHTNLDYASGGVSTALAEALNLRDPKPLQPLSGQYQKLIVFVPVDYTDRVMAAMAEEGAGTIGKYQECSFHVNGTGTFKPLRGATPFIGTQGKRESVSEQRLEMIVPRWKTAQVLRAMRRVHPYEEVAYDVYDLANLSPEYGAGVIGTLRRKTNLKEFLGHIRKKLHVDSLRYAGDAGRAIQTVAVCGGSGSEYLDTAIRCGADAFVTADVRYHTFQECDHRIALIDAGHYETEVPVINKIVEHLRAEPAVRKQKVQVIPSNVKSNFIHYF